MNGLALDQYILKEEKLLALGFQRQLNGYVHSFSLHHDEYTCQIHITNELLSVAVFDNADGEEFLPFYIKCQNGAHVSRIRAEVDAIIESLLSECFVKCDVKGELLAYAKENLHTIPVYPWEGLKHCVLKSTKKQKWYAIFMNIPYETLGLKQQGNVDIVNVKAEPEQIVQLIDRQRYFPAYHMNKKYWITILLDRNTPVDKVKEMLQYSYTLVEGQTK